MTLICLEIIWWVDKHSVGLKLRFNRPMVLFHTDVVSLYLCSQESAPQRVLRDQAVAEAGQEAGSETGHPRECVASAFSGPLATMGGVVPATPGRWQHPGRLLLGHGEPGVWHHRTARQAHHAAAVCRLQTLPAVSSDEEGRRSGRSNCQRAWLRLPAHHVQSHAVSNYGHSVALYVR